MQKEVEFYSKEELDQDDDKETNQACDEYLGDSTHFEVLHNQLQDDLSEHKFIQQFRVKLQSLNEGEIGKLQKNEEEYLSTCNEDFVQCFQDQIPIVTECFLEMETMKGDNAKYALCKDIGDFHLKKCFQDNVADNYLIFLQTFDNQTQKKESLETQQNDSIQNNNIIQ